VRNDFAGKRMELENIILSGLSEAQKARSHMFSLIRIVDRKQMQQCHGTLVTHGRDWARGRKLRT
jgi:endonuclease III